MGRRGGQIIPEGFCFFLVYFSFLFLESDAFFCCRKGAQFLISVPRDLTSSYLSYLSIFLSCYTLNATAD